MTPAVDRRAVEWMGPLAAALLAGLSCHRLESPDRVSPRSTPATATTHGDQRLTFALDGRVVRTMDRAAIERAVRPERVTAYDPNYRRTKTWIAVSVRALIEAGFLGERTELGARTVVLRARDGYAVPVSFDRLLEPGAFVALEDVEVPGWEPVGSQRVSPAPFYMIWTGPEQQDPEAFPRPWQLDRIEVVRFETAYAHTVPPAAPRDTPAWRGFELFRALCIRCHAMNREGGRVGPDLNVPQSIVEYRPESQIRAYIRNPLAFRYGSMPPHPQLAEQDLDGLMAYFRVMRDHKHDPEAPNADAGPP